MTAALSLASAVPSTGADEPQPVIGKNQITLTGDRLTPEALWAMGRIGSFTVSPDTKKIAYTVSYYSVAQNKSNSEIFLMNADGSANVQLTRDEWQESQPTWIKDGKKLAYQSNESGSMQVWEMDPDGSDRHLVTRGEAFARGHLDLRHQLFGRMLHLQAAPCKQSAQQHTYRNFPHVRFQGFSGIYTRRTGLRRLAGRRGSITKIGF